MKIRFFYWSFWSVCVAKLSCTLNIRNILLQRERIHQASNIIPCGFEIETNPNTVIASSWLRWLFYGDVPGDCALCNADGMTFISIRISLSRHFKSSSVDTSPTCAPCALRNRLLKSHCAIQRFEMHFTNICTDEKNQLLCPQDEIQKTGNVGKISKYTMFPFSIHVFKLAKWSHQKCVCAIDLDSTSNTPVFLQKCIVSGRGKYIILGKSRRPGFMRNGESPGPTIDWPSASVDLEPHRIWLKRACAFQLMPLDWRELINY